MSNITKPRFSARELQAAANALAAGKFAPTTSRPEPSRQTDLADLATQTDLADLATTELATGLGPLVRVRAANAGAGASTIALALAEVADAACIRTRVLDAAAPAWSGLLGSTVTELGAAEGWRRGRRGSSMLIDRVEDPIVAAAQVPGPRAVEGIDMTVLDAGWTPRELAATSGGWVASVAAQVDVVVTRPFELALSQAESVLAGIEADLDAGRVMVVVVGAGRWSAREFATAGPLLRTAHEHEAVLFAPLLPAKTLPGLGPGRLPKQLTIPAQRLLERITTITGR